MLRKTLCRILCCIAILCLTATSVFASGWWFNGSDQLGSIRFDFSEGPVPVHGGSLELYQVARWNDEIKGLELCEAFAGAGVSAEELFAEDAATKLSAYAMLQELEGREVEIDENGVGRVEELPLGVYLTRQEHAFPGCEPILPALISIPMEVEHSWIFDVEAAPKLEPLIPVTSEVPPPSSTVPVPPDLPPTGQVNWPIPLLIVVGSFLILLGLCLRKERKSHENEA